MWMSTTDWNLLAWGFLPVTWFSTYALFLFGSTSLMLLSLWKHSDTLTGVSPPLCSSSCPHCASLGRRPKALSSFLQLLLFSNQVTLVKLYNGDKIAHKSNFRVEGLFWLSVHAYRPSWPGVLEEAAGHTAPAHVKKQSAMKAAAYGFLLVCTIGPKARAGTPISVNLLEAIPRR